MHGYALFWQPSLCCSVAKTEATMTSTVCHRLLAALPSQNVMGDLLYCLSCGQEINPHHLLVHMSHQPSQKHSHIHDHAKLAQILALHGVAVLLPCLWHSDDHDHAQLASILTSYGVAVLLPRLRHSHDQ